MTTIDAAVATAKYGLRVGTPAIKSVGPLAFGPDGILFVADNAGATIYALGLDVADAVGEPRPIEVDRLDTRLAAYLGCAREDVLIRDMSVHPASGEVYLSVMRGTGDAAVPVLIKLAPDGTLADVPLENLPFSRTAIEDAPAPDDARQDVRVLPQSGREGELIEPRPGFKLRIARESLRTATVTDMAYVDGALIVAGASNEEFSSTLRRIPFPFQGGARSNSLEIYHVSHGRYETASPIRTFVPFGQGDVLASYTCTPVVHLSLRDAAPGAQIKGRTVAELGAGNTPIDMVKFARDGEEYLLVSNSRHPLFKVACKDIDGAEALTQPREPVGIPRETLPHKGVGRMANLNGSYVLMLQQDDAGNVDLRSYASDSL